MTYKKAVGAILENSASDWVKKVMDENNVEYRYAYGDIKDMYIEKDTIFYTVTVTISKRGPIGMRDVKVDVGGVISDCLGEINHSVIWDEDHNIIWMAVEKTRKELGITELKIA